MENAEVRTSHGHLYWNAGRVRGVCSTLQLWEEGQKCPGQSSPRQGHAHPARDNIPCPKHPTGHPAASHTPLRTGCLQQRGDKTREKQEEF